MALALEEPEKRLIQRRIRELVVRRLRRCQPAIPTGAAIYESAPLGFAAFAGDGRRLAPPREHDAAARPAPPLPTRTPLVLPIPWCVAWRSVASGGK